MTKNQMAMRNIARGTAGAVRSQLGSPVSLRAMGSESLTPKNRRRLANGALGHWQNLDSRRTSRYLRNRAERERKEAEAQQRGKAN